MPRQPQPSTDRSLTLTKVDVFEVNAVYDLIPGQSMGAWSEVSALGNQCWYDQDGQFTAEPSLPAGMYCGYLCGDSPRPFERTFDRRHSLPVRDKWLYVFGVTTGPRGSARLLHELFYDTSGAIFTANPDHFRQSDRPLHSASVDFLGIHLEQPAVGGWQELQHYLLLAPRQLPWPAIEVILADVPSYTTLLKDEFYTDIYFPDRPNERIPLTKAIANTLPQNGRVCYAVHLVDTIKEALRRRELLTRTQRVIESIQTQKHEDREYLLAKQLEAITSHRPDLRALVDPRLSEHLHSADELSRRLFLIMEHVANDLIRWIGEDERRVPIPGGADRGNTRALVSAYHRDPSGAVLPPLAKDAPARLQPPGKRNSFCALANLFRDANPADKEEIALAIASLHNALSECQQGQAWLSRNFPCFSGESDSPVDGGVGMVLSFRKFSSVALGVVIAAYSQRWARQYKQAALRRFSDWMNAKWGASLRYVPKSEQDFIIANERAARKAARRLVRETSIDKLELDPRWVETAKVSKDILKFLDLGIKAINSAYALRELVDGQADGWKWASTIADFIETYDTLRAVQKTEIAIDLYDDLGQIRKIGPLAVATGLFAIASDLRNMTKAHSASDRAGHAVSTIGSCIAVIGPFVTAAAFPLALLGAAAFFCAAGGKWISRDFSDLRRFLRYCQFTSSCDSFDVGEDNILSRAADLVDRGLLHGSFPYWYSKDLSGLAFDPEGQNIALDQILHDFYPRLLNDGTKLQLEIEISNPSQVTKDSVWSITLASPTKNAPPKVTTLEPDLVLDDQNSRFARATLERYDQPRMGAPGSFSPPQKDGHSTAEIALDLFGDGKKIYRRSCREEFVTPGNWLDS